jgi:hypothetical protein
LSERRGDYQVSVFTAPTPCRAGTVDISVLVQNTATGQPVEQARITVQLTPRGRSGGTLRYPATSDAATNKLFQAAIFELPAPGWWDVEVVVEGLQEPLRVHFDIEAEEPLPHWFDLWPWVCWPGLAILLFVLHQWLLRRKLPFRGKLFQDSASLVDDERMGK